MKTKIALTMLMMAGPVLASKDPVADAALARLSLAQKSLNSIQEAANDELRAQNARLENEIAKQQGKRQNPEAVKRANEKAASSKAKAVRSPDLQYVESIADIRASDDSVVRDLDILIANLDCAEAIIEKHNAEHPDDLLAGVADIVETLGGKPTPQRLEKAKACVQHFEQR